MNLLDLSPHFRKHRIEPAPDYIGRTLDDGTIQWGGWPSSVFYLVESLAEADRVCFLCPLCFTMNNGPVGTHKICIDFEGRGTPDDACIHNSRGEPVRWSVSGTSFSDLTLTPSIQIEGGCNWHGFVQNGAIVNA